MYIIPNLNKFRKIFLEQTHANIYYESDLSLLIKLYDLFHFQNPVFKLDV